jgi:hypothetical protein
VTVGERSRVGSQRLQLLCGPFVMIASCTRR